LLGEVVKKQSFISGGEKRYNKGVDIVGGGKDK
jgi:hypothetical protein